MPMIGNLRMDPFERAWHEGIGYPRWQFDHMFMFAPAGLLRRQVAAELQGVPAAPEARPGDK